MITFPLNSHSSFIVIEPGNIQRLKQGHPLVVKLPNGSSIMIAFTPDYFAFLEKLGMVKEAVDVKPKEKKMFEGVQILPEQIDKALKDCQNLPEVVRE